MELLQIDICSIQNIIPRSLLLLTSHSSFILFYIPRSISYFTLFTYSILIYIVRRKQIIKSNFSLNSF